MPNTATTLRHFVVSIAVGSGKDPTKRGNARGHGEQEDQPREATERTGIWLDYAHAGAGELRKRSLLCAQSRP